MQNTVLIESDIRLIYKVKTKRTTFVDEMGESIDTNSLCEFLFQFHFFVLFIHRGHRTITKCTARIGCTTGCIACAKRLHEIAGGQRPRSFIEAMAIEGKRSGCYECRKIGDVGAWTTWRTKQSIANHLFIYSLITCPVVAAKLINSRQKTPNIICFRE